MNKIEQLTAKRSDIGPPPRGTWYTGYSRPLSDPGQPSYGWYDVSVTADGGFIRRFAGHVEKGAHSSSDPVMGSGAPPTTVKSTADKDHHPMQHSANGEGLGVAGGEAAVES
ncbi:phospholipase domain-containing protein [Kribbella deserti]|uniref:Phospholipase domain-containing protein n=1 Tax=Kribbella deserti TaxID=1926257 RepID=A0ABV6QFT6_9ACTN